jgi:hypothetical protein
MNYKIQKVISKDAISYKNRDKIGRECPICKEDFNPGNIDTYLAMVTEPDKDNPYDIERYNTIKGKCDWVCSKKCSTFWILQRM